MSVGRRARPRRRAYLLAGVVALLLLIYTLTGFLVVPVIARRALTSYAMGLPGVQLRIDAVAFNPFTLQAQLRGLQLRGAGDAPLVGFRQLTVAVSPASLWRRGYTLRRIDLVDPTLDAIIDRAGRLNLLALTPPAAASGTSAAGQGRPAQAASGTGAPALNIGTLNISGGSVHFEDRSRARAFVTTLAPISFSLSDFRTQGAGDGHFQLSAHANSGEALDLSGSLAMQPLASSGQFSLQALQASTVMAYVGDALPVVLRSGQGGLAGSYRFVAAGRDTLSAHLTQLQLTDLAIATRPNAAAPTDAGAPPWLSIPQLALTDVSIELPQRQVSIASLALRQTHVAVAIEADGSLSIAQLMGAASPAATTASPAWSVSLAKLTIDAARLSLADRSVTPAVALEVGPLQLTALGYSTAGDRPVSFDLASGIGPDGHLQSHGSLMLSPFSGSVRVDLQHFDLTVLQPYISRQSSVVLYRGNLDVHAAVALAAGSTPRSTAKPGMLATGEIDLQDFATRDRLSNADFVTGRSLQIRDLRYQREPDALQIGTVRAQGLYGRVAIGSDGNLNLTALLRPPASAAGAGAGTNAARAATAGAAATTAATTARQATATSHAVPAAAMPIRIARVQLVGSAANFSDRSVQPNFSAAIEGLHGSISGLSSDPASRARVQLAGALNRYAPVTIEGQINVLSAQAYTDLALSFENIDLPLFNPYSGKFAGYSIAQGKLTTQMHYHVENRQLNATHHVVIDQLEFGAATESKQAVPLPIRFAAAMLKDRRGVITLDLPVSGSLNDPTFRVGPLVWKVFVGLLRHVVTAPFAMLGSLFGGNDSRLAYVDFAPGSATLDDTGTHKLAQLAQALGQRPQLRLDIPLHTLSEADDRALEQASLEQAVAGLTAPGAPDGPTTVGASRRGGRAKAARAQAPSVARPPSRFTGLATLYRRQFRSAPLFPSDALSIEQRADWLQEQLLPQYGPRREQRDALGLARATAAQMAVLTNKQVAATRVFLTQRATGGGPTGAVRMELQLQ